MLLVPRGYQEDAFKAIFNYFKDNKQGNPLVVMPTGTGKAIIIAMFLERVLKWFPGQRLMCLTHSKELIQQNYEKLKTMWPTAPAGIYSAGLKKKESHYPITFAGIQSVGKRTQHFGHHDIILIDEADLVGEKEQTTYLTFITKMKEINPALRVIGLTATDWRTGMGRLTNGKIFDDVCINMCTLEGFNWFLAQGYLKPLIPQPMQTTFDLGGVHTHQGEYNLKELQDAVDKADVNEAACREMMNKGHDRKHWLVFASGVEHTIHIADLLCSMGKRAVAIHSKMGDDARDDAIAHFKQGVYDVAVNNNVLTTGFDYPLIDLIGILRPSKSSRLWVQMLGRGTRPVYAPGYDLSTKEGRLQAIHYGGAPNCLVLDFARNTPRLGPINDPVIPKQKGAGGGGGEAPVKECPACGTYVHASVTVCPYCGADIPRHIKIVSEAGAAELIKAKKDEAPQAPVVEEFAVQRVTYQRHPGKNDRPDSIKVCYYVGAKGYSRYEEWVLLEHDNMRRRAEGWWAARSEEPLPLTVAEALEKVDDLKVPDVIRVRTDQKFPEILGYGKLVRSSGKTLIDAASDGIRFT